MSVSNGQLIHIMALCAAFGGLIGWFSGSIYESYNYQHLAIQHQCAHYYHTPDKIEGKFMWNDEVAKKEKE